jgi:hypothetical protein
MQRNLGEVMASQQRMLIRNGKDLGYSDDGNDLYQSYHDHLATVSRWLDKHRKIKTLFVSYNDVLSDPLRQFQKVADFLDHKVDPVAMSKVVDPKLYREKSK